MKSRFYIPLFRPLAFFILLGLSGSSFSQNLCQPVYSSGCSDGDGFTDFAVAEIENYGSGCANLNGTGWSQYLELGPAFFIPGQSYDFIMKSGYSNQNASIWIDFNDDLELTVDERILFDFNLQQSGTFYTASVTIPLVAPEGQHYMRARTNWSGTCDDPCESLTYGEAEDYYVIVGEGTFGEIAGYVTLLSGGAPVENAEIELNGSFTDYSTTSGSDGLYMISNVLAGDYLVKCTKENYNIIIDSVMIVDDSLINKNFDLTQPTIELSLQSMEVTLNQNQIINENINLENNGDGELSWSASLSIQSEAAKDYLDLQFEYPAQGSSGEAGIETDGEFIYTTIWTGNQILKYDLEGNLVGSFSISGVSALRDLAYDGTYFYGSAGIPIVFEMDFENEELVSTFNVPTDVRAIAYNDNQDVFYSGNYSNQITVFDKSGAMLGSFFTGPVGNVYYGLAYDNVSVGGPYLWGYGAAEGSQNVIVQMQLPSGNETGFYLDLEEVLNGPIYSGAGGLYTHPNLVFSKWTLGGLVQNHSLWGLELGDAQTWLWISPNGGNLQPGESQELTVTFDATDLAAGVYEADILFTSWPDVGTPQIDVTMNVTDFFFFPCEFITEVNCTNVNLTWEMCPGGAPEPDSFYVFRNDEWIAAVYEKTFTDSLLLPDSTYTYEVSWFMDGSQSAPYFADEIYVDIPSNLEPTNLDFTFSGGNFELYWDPPQACLEPAGYNIYQEGTLLTFTPDTSFMVLAAGQEYMVTAVYYFGESGPSNTIILTGIEKFAEGTILIYPNPVNNDLFISAKTEVSSLQLYDSRGKMIIRKDQPGKLTCVDVSNLDAGIYLMNVVCPNKTLKRKIIVQ